MNWERLTEKLNILANAAKYDVSCSSSGSKRANQAGGLGNSSGMGICHSYTEDGRCISLLKILLTNVCIYDCLYCVSRKSNDIKRAAFTVEEVVTLTLSFYRRNYIEGLFLSSGIFKNADYTMERLVRIAKRLREENFNGYIHLKGIPGASEELLYEAGLYADRLSVNVELPTEQGLKTLAPDKTHKQLIEPMAIVRKRQTENNRDKALIKSTPKFLPAGQSSQMIIGATDESDHDIVRLSSGLYKKYNLKRVYYSGYVPVLEHENLPKLGTPVPQIREHRLYQTDWLYRFYQFTQEEIVNEDNPFLDLDIDPKLSWALRNREFFPLNVNQASYHMLLRVPGIGVSSARKIVAARKFSKLDFQKLKSIGIAMNRAKYFITCGREYMSKDMETKHLRKLLLREQNSKYSTTLTPQLNLFS